MPMDQKVVRADFVIENSGSIEDTKHQVKKLKNKKIFDKHAVA